jgi:hypothetical protein
VQVLPWNCNLTWGNNSSKEKAITIFLRSPDEADYSLRCDWVVPAYQFPDSVYTMRVIVPRNWASVQLLSYVGRPDGEMALLIDNISLQYKPSLSVPGGVSCKFDPPAFRDLISNGDFSQNLNGWGFFHLAVNTTPGLGRMDAYRQVNAGIASGTGSGFWQQINAPLRAGSVVEWYVQVGNSSSTTKFFKLYMHAISAPGSQWGGCQIFNIPPNSSANWYRMQTVAPTDMLSMILQGYVGPDDGVPWLNIDNIRYAFRADLPASAGTQCQLQAPPGVASELYAQGLEIVPVENGISLEPQHPTDGEIGPVAPTPELPPGVTIDTPTQEVPDGIILEPVIPSPEAPAIVPTPELPDGLIIEPDAPSTDAPADATPELPPGVNVVPVSPESGS